MRKIYFLLFAIAILSFSCARKNENKSAENKDQFISQNDQASGQQKVSANVKPVYLTTDDFKAKVWDYESNPQEFVYKGDLPCIIDFYADWCKPCKLVAPIMDELAKEYKGRVIVYKVNTDKERELASLFRVTSIPSILFAPLDGKPAMQPGALSKEDYIKIIDEFVLNIKK
jgi:thioredoxin